MEDKKNSVGVRFTDENYLTRAEVAKALGTSLIDSFWNEVISYRKQFSQSLDLIDIEKGGYSLTLTSAIASKVSKLESRLNKIILEYGKLENNPLEMNAVTREMYSKALLAIAKGISLDVDTMTVNNIVGLQPVDPQFNALVNYFAALKELETSYSKEVSIDNTVLLYAKLSGQEELGNVYRTKENKVNTFVINPIYNGAPVSRIDDMMENTFNFVNSSSLSIVLKAIILQFMIDTIKPFEDNNLELSAIDMKYIMAKAGLEKAASIIPFELLIAKTNDLSIYKKEVNKTKDLTYYVIHALDIVNDAVSAFLDCVATVSTKTLANDYYRLDENTADESSPEEFVEPVKKVSKPTPAPKVVGKAVEIIQEEKVDERRLKSLEISLLESNPLLKKKQAHFYIRHRTKGKYYTIEQFKTLENCVYETARTSMDGLVTLGFYRREKVNNKKFVYTPIAK